MHQQPLVPPSDPMCLRIYWEDTDAGGVVYYANYLKFFERARTEWLRNKGVQQHTLQAQTGLLFVVADAHVRYLAPAKLDDLLTITTKIVDQSNASLHIEQHAYKGPTHLAYANIRIACVDAVHLRPQRIPAHVQAALRA